MLELVNEAKKCIGWGYGWGADGRVLTPEYRDYLVKTYNVDGTDHYHLPDGTNVEKWMGKNIIDCSGLILYLLIKLGRLPKGTDYTAEGIYKQLCRPITLSALKPGDIVFRRNSKGEIVHVGVYQGSGRTIEAKGTKFGVVEGSINDFNLFGRLKFDDELNVKDAINILAAKGKIKSPQYWIDNAVTNGKVKGEFAAQILIEFAKSI